MVAELPVLQSTATDLILGVGGSDGVTTGNWELGSLVRRSTQQHGVYAHYIVPDQLGPLTAWELLLYIEG